MLKEYENDPKTRVRCRCGQENFLYSEIGVKEFLERKKKEAEQKAKEEALKKKEEVVKKNG